MNMEVSFPRKYMTKACSLVRKNNYGTQKVDMARPIDTVSVLVGSYRRCRRLLGVVFVCCKGMLAFGDDIEATLTEVGRECRCFFQQALSLLFIGNSNDRHFLIRPRQTRRRLDKVVKEELKKMKRAQTSSMCQCQ